jgi:hypothetical protein
LDASEWEEGAMLEAASRALVFDAFMVSRNCRVGFAVSSTSQPFETLSSVLVKPVEKPVRRFDGHPPVVSQVGTKPGNAAAKSCSNFRQAGAWILS